MNTPTQNEAEMQKLEREKSFTVPPKAETNEERSVFIKDPDTMLSVTVLLVACLALAVLAHVLV